MSQTSDDLRAAVTERFAAVAISPGEERKFPVGPASAKKLGYKHVHTGYMAINSRAADGRGGQFLLLVDQSAVDVGHDQGNGLHAIAHCGISTCPPNPKRIADST